MKHQAYLEKYAEEGVEEGEKDWNIREDKNSAYNHIESEPEKIKTKAYCKNCGEIDLRGIKKTNKYASTTEGELYITEDWQNFKCIAYYIGKCPKCRKTVTKRITNKRMDDYYKRAKSVIRERNKYRLDILQPEQEGYKTLYGNWEEQVRTGKYHKVKQEDL